VSSVAQATRAAASGFLDPSLRHSSLPRAEFARAGDASDAQRALHRAVEGLGGAQARFEPPSLPAETGWTSSLFQERGRGELAAAEARRDLEQVAGELRRAVRDRELLERAVDGLLARVGELAPVPGEDGAAAGILPAYGPEAGESFEGYAEWVRREGSKVEARRRELLETGRLDRAPSFGLLLAGRSADREACRQSARSITSQIHGRWELLLPADRADLLDADVPRVRAVTGAEAAGAVERLNRLLEAARTDFVCVVEAGDELSPEALAEAAAALLDDPEIDVLYTDEDRLDAAGRRHAPFFKPDWSPDYVLSENYVGRPLFLRRSLVEEVGGFRAECEGAHEYDLLLRASERARKVAHLPKVLYHARSAPSPSEEPFAGAVLRDALRRRGEDADVEEGLLPGTFRVRRRLAARPLVSMIVPFRDQAGLLRRCVESIHRTAGYEPWEAILVDNRSWQPETRALLARLEGDPNCRIVAYDREFNWAALNNWAARRCEGELLLFLNNDVEGLSHGWLEAMVEHAVRAEVAAVGARLFYPHGLVQHAGVIVGVGLVAGHAFRFCPADRPGYRGMAKVVRNWSAVTGACMLVRRSVFEELGGFDEQLAVAYNDVDFCLRARARGYLVVYTPYAELVHHESMTRGVASDRPEQLEMAKRWPDLFSRDPYYNPNLSRLREDFALPFGEEVPLWKDLLSPTRTL
ncbi:MAG: glycosyltransferase family 2 protein, partial [Candidatus Binatia bacterium]